MPGVEDFSKERSLLIIDASDFGDTVSRNRTVLSPTPHCGLPILSDDRTVEKRRHEERLRAVAPKVPVTNPPARDAEGEDSDEEQYVFDWLVPCDAEINRIRTF